MTARYIILTSIFSRALVNVANSLYCTLDDYLARIHGSVQLIGCSLIWEIIFFMRLPRPIDVLTIRNKSIRIFRHVDNLHSFAESREKRNLTKKL